MPNMRWTRTTRCGRGASLRSFEGSALFIRPDHARECVLTWMIVLSGGLRFWQEMKSQVQGDSLWGLADDVLPLDAAGLLGAAHHHQLPKHCDKQFSI